MLKSGPGGLENSGWLNQNDAGLEFRMVIPMALLSPKNYFTLFSMPSEEKLPRRRYTDSGFERVKSLSRP